MNNESDDFILEVNLFILLTNWKTVGSFVLTTVKANITMYTITNLIGTNITIAINFLSHYSMNKKEVQKGKKIEYFSLQLIIEPKSVMKLHNFILRDQLKN